MATRTLPDRKSSVRTSPASSLSAADLVDAYSTMVLSRKIDDKEVQLKRQNKIFFQISRVPSVLSFARIDVTLAESYRAVTQTPSFMNEP